MEWLPVLQHADTTITPKAQALWSQVALHLHPVFKLTYVLPHIAIMKRDGGIARKKILFPAISCVRCYPSIAKYRLRFFHHWVRHIFVYIRCLSCRSEEFAGACIWHTLGLTRRNQIPVVLPRWRLSSYLRIDGNEVGSEEDQGRFNSEEGSLDG